MPARMFATAVVLAALSVGFLTSPAPAALTTTERKPSGDAFGRHPQWQYPTSPLMLFDTYTNKWTTPRYDDFDLDVDGSNIVHALVLWRAPSPTDSRGIDKLAYMTNRHGLTGFDVHTLPVGAVLGIRSADIAVDAVGGVHFIWEYNDDLYYRRLGATGWSAESNLTASDDTLYENPQLLVSSGGGVHIVAQRTVPTATSSYKELAHVGWNGSSITVTSIPGTRFSEYLPYPQDNAWYQIAVEEVDVRMGPTGAVHASWIETEVQNVSSGTQPGYRTLRRSSSADGTAWTAEATVYSHPTHLAGYEVRAGALYVDPQGGLHVTYSLSYGDSGQVWYAGPGAAAQKVDEGVGTAWMLRAPRVLVDSRRNLHLFWHRTWSWEFVHGTRLWTGSGLEGAWRLQADPSPLAAFSPDDARISTSDQIHLAGWNGAYTCTMEYELGARDPAAMAPVFPGAAVNVSNGNLHLSLPLFSLSGHGPTASMSLVYNSLDPHVGRISAGWKLSTDSWLIDHNTAPNNDPTKPENTGESATVVLPGGRSVYFRRGSYTDNGVVKKALLPSPGSGISARLERIWNESISPRWELHWGDGTVYRYENGCLQWIQTPDGNRIESFGGKHAGSVRDMVGPGESFGRLTSFTYDKGTLLTRIADPKGGRYDLRYSGGLLTSVVFVDGPGQPTWTFEYHAVNDEASGARAGLLKRVLPPRGTAAAAPYGWAITYYRDGRLKQVTDPPAPYLLDSEGDTAAAATRAAQTSVEYDDGILPPLPAVTEVVDRRGFRTRYLSEPGRALALEIHDPAALAGTAGIGPVVRTFDAFGNLTQVQDRWGLLSKTVYGTGRPDYVKDLVKEVWAPAPTGTGQQKAASFTHTTDGLNRVASKTVYATPTDGASAVGRTTSFEYNGYGQLITVRHPNVTRPDNVQQQNVVTTYEYDGLRRALSRVVDEEGRATTFSDFQSPHALPRRVLRDGGLQPYEYVYDVLGRVTQTRAPAGGPFDDAPGWTITAYDGMHRVSSVTDPAGKLTTFAYDLDSNVVTVIPPVGGQTTTAYDARGVASGGASPDGTWAQWVNAAGQVRRTRDVRGVETNVTLDLLGRVSEQRIPGGTTTTGGGGGPALHTTRYAYELLVGGVRKDLVTQVGPPDRVTTAVLDNRGRVKEVVLPDGATKQQTIYDELDQVVASQVLVGSTVQTCTVQFRDERQRVFRTRTQDAAYKGAFTKQLNHYLILNKAGAVVQAVDPLGSPTAAGHAHKTTFTLDARHRVKEEIDGTGAVVREYVYGDDDRVRQVLVPDPSTKSPQRVVGATYGYTSRGELKTVRDADGKGPLLAYGDLPGQVRTVTDALGRVTRLNYYADTQRLQEQIEAEGSPAQRKSTFVWANGLHTETRVPDPSSPTAQAVYRNVYDKAGRLEKLEAPLVAAERYFYNAYGEPSQTVAGLRTVTHTYNPLGLVTQSAWSGAFTKTVTRAYNGLGQPTTEDDGASARTIQYETWRGTPFLETFTVGGQAWKTQTHTFDLAGVQTSLLDPDNKNHAWATDAANRVTEMRLGTTAVSRLTYTPGGLLDTETLLSASGAPIAKTSHFYHRNGRRARAVTASAGGEVLHDERWSYDDAGQITKVGLDHLSSDTAMTFDGQGRVVTEVVAGNNGGQKAPPFTNVFGGPAGPVLSAASPEAKGVARLLPAVAPRAVSYTYHPSGTRTGVIVDGAQTTYAYNAAGQLTTETTASTNTTVSYEYDEWGNQKRRLKKQGATVLSDERFGYNYRNLLSTYTNSSTGANWQYDYWPTGERYGKTNLSTSESELYIPRFGDVLSEYTKTGTAAAVLKNTYVQGLGLDSKRSRIAAGGARRHFVTNQVGTVELTLDDAGAVAEQTRRDAYGVVLGSASSERYGFAQREHDAESGLVYMRHRMYDPSTGRFTQTDPLRHRRPHAHYAYAANNPVSLVDPMGLQEHGTPLTADEVSWAKGRLYDPQNPTSLQVLGIYIEQGVFRWKHGARDLPENQARNRRNHERGHIANLDLIDEGRGDYHSYFPSLAGKYDFISGVPTFEDLKQLSFDQRFLLTANHPGLFRDQGRYQLITPAERPKISEYIQKGVAYGVGIAAAGSILEAILPEKKGLDIALGLRRVIRGGKEIRALDDFADSVGAAPAGKWKSLGLFDKEIEEKSLGFGLAFKQAATRTITGGGKIRFNLTYADIDRLKRASHTVIDEYTGWEYQQIIRHRRLWDNTVWYLDGQVVGAGKLRELGVEFIGK